MDITMNLSNPIRWHSAAMTDKGNLRTINEDACLDYPDIGMWVVADGMGGHDAGDIASLAIVDNLQQLYQFPFIEAYVEAVDAGLQQVNRELLEIANAREVPTTIGSTVAALIATNDRSAVLWAGDSRVYRLREDKFEAVSSDHSQVQELVDLGLVDAADAEAHPCANVITRAVGAAQELQVDVIVNQLQSGDQYLICSDGLFKEVSELEIHHAMQRSQNVEAVVQHLMMLSKSRAARDNISLICVKFTQDREATQRGPFT